MIWHPLAFCDSPVCSVLLDCTWTSAMTSSTERGGHVDVWCSVLAGCCWLVVVFCGCFGVCVCFGFRTCSVSPPLLRSLRTAYCAADAVKRHRSRKKKKTLLFMRQPDCRPVFGSVGFAEGGPLVVCVPAPGCSNSSSWDWRAS